jgi:Ca2+-binding RTX toxin-like protein
MAVTTTTRPSLGSGSIKFIDGIPFEGIGSGGFTSNDLLIIGDDSDNVLIGGSGNDDLEGGGGNDILKEGLGNGILNGGDGNDDLDGGPGTEKLFGGAGDDILRAGGTAPAPGQVGDYDRLNGGAGHDTFGFYGVGHFQIADFTLGEDRLFFDSSVLGITDVGQLFSYITNITDHGVIDSVSNLSSFTVDFGPDASIELVGVGVTPSAITADMIVFNL